MQPSSLSEGSGIPEEAPLRRRRVPNQRLNLWLAGVFLICFMYFLPRAGDWGQDARLDSTLALVNRGQLYVDAYRWNAGVDVAHYHGHWYEGKAPGLSLAAVPFYAAYKGVLQLTGRGHDALQIGLAHDFKRLYYLFFIAQAIVTIYTVAIPSALFMMLFFWFLGYFTTSTRDRILLTLALGLATSVFPFAQVIFPHDQTAALLFAAFVLFYIARRSRLGAADRAIWLSAHPAVTCFLAGLALGGAFLFDHTAAIPGLIIGLYGLTCVPPRLLPYVVAGGIPPLAVVFGYDYLAFHNIGITGYNYNGAGVGGSDATGIPYVSAIWGMTFSPYRGLFFLSPFLLMAIPGFLIWRRQGGLEWLLCLVAPMALFAAVTTLPYWQGGSSVGPRYLVQVLPFLALPIIFVLNRYQDRRSRLVIYFLVALSTLNVWIQTMAAQGYPTDAVINPLFQASIPAVMHGNIDVSIGTILVAPFVGFRSLWTLVPLPIFLALWTLFCSRPVRARAERDNRQSLSQARESTSPQ